MNGGRVFSLDSDEFDSLVQKMESFGERAADVVTEVIHGEGSTFKRSIDPLIPVSGRTFKGHASPARGSAWERYDTGERMAITISTTSARRYLYFPDDGSNTRRHAGNQHFFIRGVEQAAPEVLEKITERLTESL